MNHATPVTTNPPWKVIEKTIRSIRRNSKLFRAVNSTSPVERLDLPEAAQFTGDCLISTDRGVFAIQGGEMFRLTQLDAYGLAIRGDQLFVVFNSDEYSCVSRCILPSRLTHGGTLSFTELYRVPVRKSGRVHQIAFYQDILAVTQTVSNSIVFLDPDNGAVLSECFPFRDQFGNPIRNDHNHINSVSACGDCLLFCAYRAGAMSMIGVIEGNRVKGYLVKNMGAHDVHITGDTLYYSDTFGATFTDGTSECGFLMANGQPVDEEFFSIAPGFAIRGISRKGNEMIVGHSHKGLRSKRFEGNGALFRLVDDRVVQVMTVPFAQTYDILRMDGRHFDAPPAVETWMEVTGFLESILGPAIYEMTLDEPALGRFPKAAAKQGRESASASLRLAGAEMG